MNAKSKVNLGDVQVHKKVLRDIVFSTISDIDGISLSKKGRLNSIVRLTGLGKYSGIHVRVNDNQEVTIEVKIFVRYGLNIPDIAKRIQNSIKSVLEKTANINLKGVDINIQGIERG